MKTTIKTRLAQRQNGGIEVTLLWNRSSHELTVTVVDDLSDDIFELPVAPDDALNAYYHPYAYICEKAGHRRPRVGA